MTLPEALEQLHDALDNARPGCFAQVSPYALRLALEALGKAKPQEDG